MANAYAREAVACLVEKACCQSVLDRSFVPKITVEICGCVVFFLHLSHVSFSTPGQCHGISEVHYSRVLDTLCIKMRNCKKRNPV